MKSKPSTTLGHLHPLKKGKKYTISTTRDKDNKGPLGFAAFVVKGGKRTPLLLIENLLPDTKYSVEYKSGAAGESLLLTHWHKVKGKWEQLDSIC